MYWKGKDQFEWFGSSDRLLEAFRLYKRGAVSKIVITGGNPIFPLDVALSETESMASALKEFGVPEQDIVLETKSGNTRENALFLFPILKEKKIDDFYLVTSAFHMRRSMAVFKKLGMKPTPYPVDYESLTNELTNYPMGVANVRLYLIALHEYFGYAVYRLRGFI